MKFCFFVFSLENGPKLICVIIESNCNRIYSGCFFVDLLRMLNVRPVVLLWCYRFVGTLIIIIILSFINFPIEKNLIFLFLLPTSLLVKFLFFFCLKLKKVFSFIYFQNFSPVEHSFAQQFIFAFDGCHKTDVPRCRDRKRNRRIRRNISQSLRIGSRWRHRQPDQRIRREK